MQVPDLQVSIILVAVVPVAVLLVPIRWWVPVLGKRRDARML
jgi:hypothetical protein